MSLAHGVVAVLGLLSLLESLWGLAAPGTVQGMAARARKESPPRSPGLGVTMLAFASMLWLLVSPEQRMADYILILYSWLLVGIGLLNFREGGMANLLELLLLDRSPTTIRLLYAVEFCWAVGVLIVALRGL